MTGESGGDEETSSLTVPGAAETRPPLPFADRLTVPVIAAPMLRVSGVELVSAACEAGVIGAFPTANCRSQVELEAWLTRLDEDAARAQDRGCITAPYCPNLIMRRDLATLRSDVDSMIRHGTEVVITSVGSPAAVVPMLHDAGCLVLADVASMKHVEKALEAGADGLVLLVAGAGGQTGWANPFAFVRAVRQVFSGPVVMGGGIGDGVALRAAIVLGCDLGYMGTRFIATHESMAADAYRGMLVQSSLDDVMTTRAFTGVPANFLRPSVTAAGLDPSSLREDVSVAEARARFGGGSSGPERPARWASLWSAGHSVSNVDAVLGVADLVAAVRREY